MSGDYIMRQIENMTRFVGSVILHRRLVDDNLVTEEGSISAGGLLRLQLRQLLAQNQVNQAENVLFSAIEADPKDDYLPVALDFYQHLNTLSDEVLSTAGFSRREIADGLHEICRLYGVTPSEELLCQNPE